MARLRFRVAAATIAAAGAGMALPGGCSGGQTTPPQTVDAADDGVSGADGQASSSGAGDGTTNEGSDGMATTEASPPDAVGETGLPSDASGGGDQQTGADTATPPADSPTGLDAADASFTANPPCRFSSSLPACTQVCNTAPLVQVAFSTATPPAPAGGTVAPGTYYMTGVTYYLPADAGTVTVAAAEQQTAMVSAASPTGIVQLIRSDNGAPNTTSTFEYTPAGSSLDVTFTCPGAGQVQMPFTATASGFDLLLPQSSSMYGAYLVDEHFEFEGLDAGPRADAASDAGASADAADAACARPPSDAQGQCNAVCNGAPVVTETAVPSLPSTSWSGGAIPDGTYYLVSKTRYDGPDGGADGGAIGTVQETLVVSTSGSIRFWQDVQSVSGGADLRSTVSVYGQGSTLYLTGVCPAPAQDAYQYTFSSSELYLLQPAGNGPATLSVFAML